MSTLIELFLLLIVLSVFTGIGMGAELFSNRRDRLNKAFYRLIKRDEGKVSLMTLAMEAGLEAENVDKYLQKQVKMFNANPLIDADGGRYWQFPQLSESKTT